MPMEDAESLLQLRPASPQRNMALLHQQPVFSCEPLPTGTTEILYPYNQCFL